MSAIKDIFEWSQSIPMWQQDALRLLVLGKSPDVIEAANLCLEEAGGVYGNREPLALRFDQINVDDLTSLPVRICRVFNINGVGALRGDAEIAFHPEGLNCIYGENGSGKSSFVRLLRQFCRCSAPKEGLLGNVFKEEEIKTSAVVEYLNGAEEKQYGWDGSACNEELMRVSIFDGDCASVLVSKDKELAFTPFGLDLLPRLADLCDSVAARIDELIKDSAVKKLIVPHGSRESGLARWYGELTGLVTDVAVKENTTFGEDEKAELDRVTKVLAEGDPETRIKELQARLTRILELKTRVNTLSKSLSEKSVVELRRHYVALQDAEKAADLLAKEAFEMAPLSGGGGAWRALWEAARSFAEAIEMGDEFPIGGKLDKCLLCQQDVPPEVAVRLSSFEAFVKASVESQRKQAKDVLDGEVRDFKRLPVVQKDDKALWEELDSKFVETMKVFLESCGELKKSIEDALEGKFEWGSIVSKLESPISHIDSYISTINEDIALQKRIFDPEEKKSMLENKAELECKYFLSENKEYILKEVVSLRLIDLMSNSKKTSLSTSISKKSKDLVDRYLTSDVRDAFKSRVNSLFDGSLSVSFEKTKTQKGAVFFRVVLPDAKRKAGVDQVLSEGEFRSVALAAFLAEIDMSPHGSSIIFDDPVSSLDHKRRALIADVLAREAARRQVLVFTHDIYFLSMILAKAKEYAIPTGELHVHSFSRAHGYVVPGVPMSAKSFDDRAKDIRTRVAEVEALVKSGDFESGVERANDLGVLMRRLCEFSVENILLGGVVRRYDKAIHVDILKKRGLLTIEESDINMFMELLEYYSNYVHEKTMADEVPHVDVDRVKKDLEEITQWKKAFPKRAAA